MATSITAVQGTIQADVTGDGKLDTIRFVLVDTGPQGPGKRKSLKLEVGSIHIGGEQAPSAVRDEILTDTRDLSIDGTMYNVGQHMDLPIGMRRIDFFSTTLLTKKWDTPVVVASRRQSLSLTLDIGADWDMWDMAGEQERGSRMLITSGIRMILVCKKDFACTIEAPPIKK